ncbi:Protein FAR1-RELATED SEQUENCE [Abeliophyllum distichum]|uniref:Protein FAR1-RELATED SEQUENCE n=1 Tax=Abeliophyllum distichum TaxID=126358 RepID=A0ABD1RGC0_9LAMI
MNVVLYNDQYHRLVHIIKQSESPAEFEQRWIEVMETTELSSNEWLSSLFEIRSRWVPAYVKHVFAAGMSSSQRLESGHSFLKKYVEKKNSLTDIIARFNRALVHQRHEELAANHIDLSQTPKVTTALMMENQMVQIYTKKIFLLIQNELVQSNSYICSKRSSFDEGKVYAVQPFEPGRTSDRIRLRIRVKDIDTGGDVGMSTNRNKSREETQVVRDPNPVRAKGCGKRLRSEKEKALSQSNRQCSACGTSGHDRRTCPTLQNRVGLSSLFHIQTMVKTKMPTSKKNTGGSSKNTVTPPVADKTAMGPQMLQDHFPHKAWHWKKRKERRKERKKKKKKKKELAGS